MRLRRLSLLILFVITACPQAAYAQPASVINATHFVAPPAGESGFWYRLPLIIDNTRGSEDLINYQVKVALGSQSPEAVARHGENADIRFTDKDTGLLLPYWVEYWGIAGQPVVAWVKVPLIKAGTQRTIYYHYHNINPVGAAYPMRVFDFYDDFGTAGTGYFDLSPAHTVMTKTQQWESAAPHTLSVVQLDRDGYRYWGYYGLTNCGGIGLTRSNDLTHWEKYASNPLIKQDGERWPSAAKVGDTVYMVHTRDYCGTSHLVLRSSKDGLNFGAVDSYTVIVPPEKDISNQNPNLFYDTATQKYYLYWFRGGQKHGAWEIRMRSAATAAGLAQAASRTVIRQPYEIAAPHMMVYDGYYYLATEVNENAWKTRIFVGDQADGPFKELPGNPVLGNNEACFFQHVFSNTLHAYYCKDNGDAWVVNHRTANLAANRPFTRKLDESKWDVSQAGWTLALDDTDPSHKVVLIGKSEVEVFTWSSAYKGSNYIVDLNGRLAGGSLWSVGVRSDDNRSMYRVDLKSGSPAHMSISRWVSGTSTVLGDAPLPGVDLTQWFSLSVTLAGAKIETSINGRAGALAHDDQIKEGRLTLIAPAGSMAVFDNVRVRKYAKSEPTLLIGKSDSWHLEDFAESPNSGVLAPDEPAQPQVIPDGTPFLIAIALLGAALVGGVGYALWKRRINRYHW